VGIQEDRNKKILKNTIYMYFRMILFLIISLFTARLIYHALGVDNFGIYNLVGGIIVFFTFLNGALATATKRYITTEIGSGNTESTKHVFSICIQAHLLIAFIIFLLAETVGLGIVNYVLNIPSNRIFASNWVYQLSVLTAILGIFQSPFSSVILAYEKLSIYAFFSIFDVITKLIVVYLVLNLNGDKLIVYAILIFISGLINLIIYYGYSITKFEICRFKLKNDKKLFKEIFSFTSWSLLGQAAVVATNQGSTMLVNLFFSVSANAAMGISNSIVNAVNGFVSNFQVSFNPQITKSYARKDFEYLQTLIVRASKISSFLLLIFAVPIIIETSNILTLWLGKYPEYTVDFCRYSFADLYFEALSAPLWMLMYSDYRIKRYQIIISVIYSMNFGLSFIFLYYGFNPPVVMIIRAVVDIFLLFIRLKFATNLLTNLKYNKWMKSVLMNGILIFLIAFTLSSILYNILGSTDIIINLIVVSTFSVIWTCSLIYFLGFDKEEKVYVKKIIKRYIYNE